MRVEIIEGTEAIRNLRPQWDAIYDADPEAQYFLSWSWLFGYLAPMGRDAFVLAARPDAEGSPYVALLPLRLRTRERKGKGFHNEINLAGNYVSDYAGFICRPGFEEQALPALADKIRQLNWRRLRLEYFCASAYRSELFLRGFAEDAFEANEPNLVNSDGTDNSICPFVTLTDDWDRYLETKVSSNTRQKIRRFLRQVEGSGSYHRITHTNGDTLERDIELLLALWTEKWGARKGDRLQAILNADRRMLRQAFSTGTLFMPVLWHGDRAICVLAFLTDDRKKTYNFYRGGRDENFKGPPPGLVLHAYAIRHAIANGVTTYDFLRGNEQYKYSFGCEERRIWSLILSTKDQQNLGGKLDARSIPRVLQRAFELHQANQLAEAERGYRQILDVDPRHTKALYLLGQVTAKRGDHVTALKQYRALITLVPDQVSAWYGLGRSLQACGAWAEAADAYCEAIARQARHPKVYSNLGQVLLKLDQLDHAVTAFEAALGLEADHADAIVGRSEALQVRGAISPSKAAQRASRHAAVGERVAKIGAIAAAARRFKESMIARRPAIKQGAGAVLLVQPPRPPASSLHNALATRTGAGCAPLTGDGYSARSGAIMSVINEDARLEAHAPGKGSIPPKRSPL